MDTGSAGDTVRIQMRVNGEPLQVTAPKPPDSSRLDQLLPIVRALDDLLVDRAVAETESRGACVTCAKGCSACCRAQPVPVTPPEAYALLRLVESLPEPRQTAVRTRFEDRVRRLRDAGLASVYLNPDPNLTPERAEQVARQYWSLGLVCPFLEDDACGIYPDRPFVCRQYLVTSPAVLCADPFGNRDRLRLVETPLRFAHATLQLASEVLGTPQRTVPLTLALEYARTHRAELERTYDAPQLASRWMEVLLTPEPAGGEGPEVAVGE